MDGLQVLIYIVIAIVYFIIKGINKTGKPNASSPTVETEEKSENPTFPDNRPPRKTGPLSFEDLLNEFGEASGKVKKQVQTRQPEPTTADEGSFYEIAQEKAKQQKRKAELKAKQAAKRALEQRERQEAISLEKIPSQEYIPVYDNKANQVDYEDPTKANYEGLDDKKKRFTPFDIKERTPNLFAKIFKDPQSARTAFIMGEIFKRKYN